MQSEECSTLGHYLHELSPEHPILSRRIQKLVCAQQELVRSSRNVFWNQSLSGFPLVHVFGVSMIRFNM
jgi:hypothetical protein